MTLSERFGDAPASASLHTKAGRSARFFPSALGESCKVVSVPCVARLFFYSEKKFEILEAPRFFRPNDFSLGQKPITNLNFTPPARPASPALRIFSKIGGINAATPKIKRVKLTYHLYLSTILLRSKARASKRESSPEKPESSKTLPTSL